MQLEPTWYLVIDPQVHVSTKLLFQSELLNRSCTRVDWPEYEQGLVGNVFQDIVFDLYPKVKQAYDWLSEFGKPRMTGTGACVFLELATEVQCQHILSQLPSKFNGFYAQGC